MTRMIWITWITKISFQDSMHSVISQLYYWENWHEYTITVCDHDATVFGDPTVFDIIGIDATGELTYQIVGIPDNDNTLINVVFVVK